MYFALSRRCYSRRGLVIAGLCLASICRNKYRRERVLVRFHRETGSNLYRIDVT